MFDLTAYVKKWRIRQLKTVFSTLDTLCKAGDSFNLLEVSLILLLKLNDIPWSISRQLLSENGKSRRSV